MRSVKFLRRVIDLVYAMDERENWARCELADGGVYIVLPPSLPPKKLERLRWLDALGFRELDAHIFANFLPDDERPADVLGPFLGVFPNFFKKRRLRAKILS